MEVLTASTTTSELGALAQRVTQYSQMIEERATGEGGTIDWGPVSELVAIDDFVRVGAYLETMNWAEYTAFLSEWAGSTKFEATVFRIIEAGNVVIKEIEERHYRGDDFIKKNVISVYEFDDDQKIRHLDIYEQAEDSGQWIIEAATRAR